MDEVMQQPTVGLTAQPVIESPITESKVKARSQQHPQSSPAVSSVRTAAAQLEKTATKLIGTAVPADLFVLLETPLPWGKPALLSEGVPEIVRQALKPHLGKYPGLRVHLIANEETAQQQARRLIICQRQLDSPQRYSTWEMRTTSPEQMAMALSDLLSQPPGEPLRQSSDEQSVGQAASNVFSNRDDNRHLLVCTHGSHNECCGIQGYPLYQDAIALMRSLTLNQTHIWQVSHIGGHRYAPTLIDLPQGRYYGELNRNVLKILLQQQGELDELMECYRGWSLLPKALQVQEQKILSNEGWSWFLEGSWQQVKQMEQRLANDAMKPVSPRRD